MPDVASAQPATTTPPAAPAAPAAPTSTPAAPPSDPAAQPAAAADPVTTPPATPPAEERVPRSRLDREVHEKWEARRRAEALEQEKKQLEDQLRLSTGVPAADDPVTVDRLVEERAQQLAREAEFNQRCDRVFKEGVAKMPDFQEALKGFAPFGGLGAHVPFLDLVTQESNAPELLHHLATHPDEAQDILQAPPGRQGALIGRLSARLEAKAPPPAPPPPRVSGAPTPTEPISGGGGGTAPKGPDDQGKFKSQDDFREWRAKQFRRH